MKNVLKNHVNLLAMLIMALTAAFTFSCSSDSGSGGGDSSDSGYGASSSSGGSSSSGDGTSQYECEGAGYFNPAMEFCQSTGDGAYAVKPRCNNQTYSYTQFCQEGTNVVKSLCGDKTYSAAEFCLKDYYNTVEPEIKPLCGTKEYSISEFCQNPDVVKSLCNGTGGVPYTETEFCQYDYSINGYLPKPLCGAQEYSYSQFCVEGSNEVKSFCGDRTFGATEFCGYDSNNNPVIKTLCADEEYSYTQFCQEGTNVVKSLCGYYGGEPYSATEFCQQGYDSDNNTTTYTVKPLCGTEEYDEARFCQSPGVVEYLCNGRTFTATEECCYNDIPYNPTTHFCSLYGQGVLLLCGTKTYSSNEFCQSPDVVKNLCGGNGGITYDATVFCQSRYSNGVTDYVLTPFCGTEEYTSFQFCQSPNVVKDLCNINGVRQEYGATEFCQNVSYGVYAIQSLCGAREYEANQRCGANNVVETKCGTTGDNWYNHENQICQNSIVQEKCGTGNRYRNVATEECCDDIPYATASLFCQSPNNVVKGLCGGNTFPATQECCNGSTHETAINGCCNNDKYTRATHFCLVGSKDNPNAEVITPLCGGIEGYRWYQRCENGVVEAQCGSVWYNIATQKCEGSSIMNPCGDGWYGTNQICENGVIKNRCGTTSNYYNPTNQKCTGNTIETQCGTGWYNTSQRCTNNVIEAQCGTNNWYSTQTQRCSSGNVIETLCGGYWYNTVNTSLRCQNNVLETPCGTGWRSISTEYCSNGTVKTYGYIQNSNGNNYKTVVIGSQTWMADNLRDIATPCDYWPNGCNYGTMYNWVTATGNICPEGWHIPTRTEFEVLINFVGGSSVAGKHLKSKERWEDYNEQSGSGEDTYGFAFLPTGEKLSESGGQNNFGWQGSLWTADEGTYVWSAINLTMTRTDAVGFGDRDRGHYISVRCLKN